jgi:hypothetical protein
MGLIQHGEEAPVLVQRRVHSEYIVYKPQARNQQIPHTNTDS